MSRIKHSHLVELEKKYCSQGDISGKRKPKKYFVSARGSFLYGNDGTKYLDFQMFNSAANFGYLNEIHTHAVEQQLRKLPSLASEFMHAARVELSSLIAQRIEKKFGLEGRVQFSVGGAQAVDDALKIIANKTGTRNVFAFEGSYHGRTIGASGISSSYRYRRRFGAEDHAHFIPFPYCYRCAYGLEFPSSDYYCVSRFERLFESEFHGVYDPAAGQSEYRAFFLEPVLGRGGYVVPPPEYYRKLKDVLDRYKILLVVDEIQMGFYRTGKLWAIEHFGVTPDIIIFGKSISNGLFPLSGLWAREDLISPEVWPPGSSHATFMGHPLAMAAGLATFDLIDSTNLEEMVVKRGHTLELIIYKLNEEFGIFGRVDVLGLAIGLEICQQATSLPAPELAKNIAKAALDIPVSIKGERYGLILTTGGYHNHVLMLSPSVLITEEEILLFEKLFRHYITLALRM